jgi:hypothetical protein
LSVVAVGVVGVIAVIRLVVAVVAVTLKPVLVYCRQGRILL